MPLGERSVAIEARTTLEMIRLERTQKSFELQAVSNHVLPE